MKISMVASSGMGYIMPKGSLESRRLEEVRRAFSRLAELGYDGVELSIEEPFQTRSREIANASAQYGLEIPAIGTGLIHKYLQLSLSDMDEIKRGRAVNMLIKSIEVASELDSLVIIGLVRGRMEPQRMKRIGKFRKSMRECDRFAGREGVRLAIEPLNRYEADYINNVEEALNFLSGMNLQSTGLLLDTFHMNIEERKIEDAIRRAGRMLEHLHVADSNRLAPGLGHIEFPTVMRALADLGYDRYLSAEILAPSDPLKAARITIGYLQNLLEVK
jgi:sugar phosphate isomerase/epimerase